MILMRAYDHILWHFPDSGYRQVITNFDAKSKYAQNLIGKDVTRRNALLTPLTELLTRQKIGISAKTGDSN